MRRDEIIRLGLMAPMSGLVKMYGPEISWAGRIACDEINEKGGILGIQLELVTVDDGSLPDTAVPAAERLIDEFDCSAIIGNLLSNSRISVANRVSEPRRIPYLNFSFYEGSIHGRYFFHFAALPNQQIDHMIPYMAKHFGPKMFFAGNNYEWPRGSIDAAKRTLIALHGEIIGEEYLPINCDEKEIDHLLNQVARSGADVFVPYFAGADQIKLLTHFNRLGLKSRMAVIMGHYDEAMVANLTPNVRKDLYSCNTYFMSVNTPENHAYLSRLAKLPEITGIWPNGNGILTNFGEGTYICVHAFANAAEKAGSVEAEALVDALEHVRVIGPQGVVAMDPTTHHARVNSYLARCDADGSFSIMEQLGEHAPMIPKRYDVAARKYLRPDKYRSKSAAACPITPEIPKATTLKLGIAITTNDGVITNVNPNFPQIWGYRNEQEILGRNFADLWDDEIDFENIKKWCLPDWGGTLTAKLANGGSKVVDVAIEPTSYCIEPRDGYTLFFSDQEKTSDTARIFETAQHILSVADIAVIATDTDGLIIQANRETYRLFGYETDELKGLSVHLLLPPQYRSRHGKYLAWYADSAQSEISMGHRGEITGYRKDGTFFPAKASLTKFEGPTGLTLVATIYDLSRQKDDEKQLLWHATHDDLTHLPNRALIQDRIANALDRSIRDEHNVAVLFLDIDRFKLINESYGHEVGDRALITIGNRLIEQVRPGDTVSRFGGDRFVILCDYADDLYEISNLAEQINQALRKPIEIRPHRLILTGSIGIAYGTGSTHTADDLLRNADAAIDKSMEFGQDGWRLFNKKAHMRATEQLAIATGLREALDKNELSVHFQPIVSCNSGEIEGVEALLRWTTANGPITPNVFIPVAEATGTISSIGLWVFEQACKQEKIWRSTLGDEKAPYISVNLSARQLHDNKLVDAFADVLQKSGANPKNIVLEITETSLMTDIESNIVVLNRLAELGMELAVDDFGTGYSSLSQMMRLNVQILKIDQIFINGIEKNTRNKTIVDAVIKMSHALTLKVVAEGVETEDQFNVLRNFGCNYIQGFLFYRPMDATKLGEALLAQSR